LQAMLHYKIGSKKEKKHLSDIVGKGLCNYPHKLLTILEFYGNMVLHMSNKL